MPTLRRPCRSSAKYLGLSSATVLRRAREGEIPGGIASNVVRFDPDEVDRWLWSKRNGSGGGGGTARAPAGVSAGARRERGAGSAPVSRAVSWKLIGSNPVAAARTGRRRVAKRREIVPFTRDEVDRIAVGARRRRPVVAAPLRPEAFVRLERARGRDQSVRVEPLQGRLSAGVVDALRASGA